jgi:hypothetical protein
MHQFRFTFGFASFFCYQRYRAGRAIAAVRYFQCPRDSLLLGPCMANLPKLHSDWLVRPALVVI